jgi:hypothetical protein
MTAEPGTLTSASIVNLLPTEGPLWHSLRSGEFSLPTAPEKIPFNLGLLIQAMMNPVPQSRPTASNILTLGEVRSIENDPSLYTKDWESICYSQPRALLNRTASYDPSMNQPR